MELKDLYQCNLLYLSPHYDDMVYSNGGLINLLKLHNTRITNLNFFTKSSWTADQSNTMDEKDISKLRSLEEETVCKELDVHTISLGLKDSSARGLSEWEEMTQKMDDNEIRAVKEIFLSELPTNRFDYILAPLGLGGHIDHLAVYQIAESLKSFVLYYEDMPYGMKNCKGRVGTIVMNKNQHLRPLLIRLDDHRAEKYNYIKKYKSQAEPESIQLIMKYGRTLANAGFWERIWYQE